MSSIIKVTKRVGKTINPKTKKFAKPNTVIRHAIQAIEVKGKTTIAPKCMATTKHRLWQTDFEGPNCPKCINLLEEEKKFQ